MWGLHSSSKVGAAIRLRGTVVDRSIFERILVFERHRLLNISKTRREKPFHDMLAA